MNKKGDRDDGSASKSLKELSLLVDRELEKIQKENAPRRMQDLINLLKGNEVSKEPWLEREKKEKEKKQKAFDKALKIWEEGSVRNWDLSQHEKELGMHFGNWKEGIQKCKKLEELIKPFLTSEKECEDMITGLCLLFVDLFYFYKGGKRCSKEVSLKALKYTNSNMYWAINFMDKVEKLRKKTNE